MRSSSGVHETQTACNYDADATDDDGSCEFPADLYGSANLDCDGACLNDSDGDSVCDEDEVAGCEDDTACNYNAEATDDDGSCTYPAADNLDCDGACLNDADGDGVCDEDEIDGWSMTLLVTTVQPQRKMTVHVLTPRPTSIVMAIA